MKRDPDERRILKDEPSSDLVGPKRQCTATSKATGERCKRYVSAGMRTCRVHGSATRKTKVAAAKRIAQASGYAAEMLVEFMADPATPLKDRVQIAQDLLNRAGVSGKDSGQNEKFEFYQNIVLASTMSRHEIDDLAPNTWPPGWKPGLPVPQGYTLTGSDPNVIDAEIVEDDTREQTHDAQVEAVERERAKRRRRGLDPELPPAVEQRVRPQPAPAPRSTPAPPAPSIEDDPRHRAPVSQWDDVTTGRERFLLQREALAPKRRHQRRTT